MQLRQRHVQEERLSRRGLFADEGAAPVGEVGVDAPAHLQVIGLALLDGLAGPAFHDMGNVDHLRVKANLLGEHALVGGAGNAVPVVKTPVLGVAPLLVTQVPLAIHSRGVARLREQLRDGDLPRVNALRQARRD